MALTKISTDGVKDDAVTAGKIPANAVGSSELADNAVDTNAIQDDAVTADKLANSINTAIATNTAKTTNATHTGDVTGSTSLTLANSGVSAGSYGSATAIPAITVDSKGRITAASTNNVSIPAGITINNQADNRIITATGTSNTLNGEANLSFDGVSLHLNAGSNGLPKLRLQHSGSGNDVFEITSGLTGVSNGGFGIYDVDTSAYRFAIDSSGNVGINKTSPQQQLHVHDSTAYKGILVTGNGAPRIGFGKSNATDGEWSAGIDGTNGDRFCINNSNDNSANYIILDPNTSQAKVVLCENTQVNGNLKFGTSGNGLDFSADGSASGMASELLDDYEEGTWTPVLQNAAGRYNMHADNCGAYVKIGNLVSLSGTLRWSAIGDSSDTNWFARINNVPFTPKALPSGVHRVGQTMGASTGSSITPTSGYESIVFFLDNSTSYIYIVQQDVSSGGYNHTPTVGTSGGIYGFQLVYRCT